MPWHSVEGGKDRREAESLGGPRVHSCGHWRFASLEKKRSIALVTL